MYYDNDTFDAYDENDEPVCVCEDYYGATHPVFCKACNCWTDETEEAMIALELIAETPETPALPRITTPVYQITLPVEEVA